MHAFYTNTIPDIGLEETFNLFYKKATGHTGFQRFDVLFLDFTTITTKCIPAKHNFFESGNEQRLIINEFIFWSVTHLFIIYYSISI